MDVPRKRGRGRSKAVEAKAPAASASPAVDQETPPSFVMRRSSPRANVLAAMDAETEGAIADRDDGTDLFETSHTAVESVLAEDRRDDAGGTVEETTGKVWVIPDTVGTLRRMPNALETVQRLGTGTINLADIARQESAAEDRSVNLSADRRVVSIRKHRTGETMKAVPVPEIATNVTEDTLAAGGPEYMRPRRAKDLDRGDFDGQQPRETRDALTQRLGCRWFIDGARLDWCREGPFNLNPPGEPDSRHRHHFTRWYEMDRILVDIFARDSDAVRREIGEKIAAIRERSKVEGAPIGYLPAVKGAYITDDVIAAVKRGEIVPFQLAQMRSGAVAV